MDKQHEILLRQVRDPEQLNNYSLVLSAANIPHRVEITPGIISIFVQNLYAVQAENELQSYDEKLLNWPPPRIDPLKNFNQIFKAMPVVLITWLVYVYGTSGPWDGGNPLFLQAAGDTNKILHQHQFYRLVTALFLHADWLHLLGNCLIGGILLTFFFGVVGNGIGLFAILLTGALANYLNIILHGGDHLFVGFSTAIFSVAGMLCTINFFYHPKETSRKSRIQGVLMPIMAGFALLALLGSSGERTDLGAHLLGLLVGFVAGNMVRFRNFEKWRARFILQMSLGVAATGISALCWYAKV